VLRSAEGLPDAKCDSDLEIINWPQDFQKRYRTILNEMTDGWDDDDFLEFAVWFELYDNPKIPQGILIEIARMFYDHPDVPSQNKIKDAVQQQRNKNALN
jgi:hypothetical protein